jgi:hypothetical protein
MAADDVGSLHLECLVMDACDPVSLARFWSGLLGMPPVDEPSADGVRLRYPGLDDVFLDVLGGDARDALVERALAAGAAHVDVGQGDRVPWVVLVDPEDNAFCVMPQRREYTRTGPIAAVPIDADDVPAATAFWLAASDWVAGDLPDTLRHPSGTGPILAFTDPVGPKRGKNPLHLDLRVAPGASYDDALDALLALGARPLTHDWGELPWTVLLDPGNNEFCLLRAQE